ncbi:hypothetical protein CON32_23570 [Bacillus cereus]|nr:hypothetical protein CON32_23570 [Bacillus cereus]
MDVSLELALCFKLKFEQNRSSIDICSILGISEEHLFTLNCIMDERVRYFMTHYKVTDTSVFFKLSLCQLSSLFKSSFMLKSFDRLEGNKINISSQNQSLVNTETLDIKYVSCEIVEISRVIEAYSLGDYSKILLEPLSIELEEEKGCIYPIRSERKFNCGIELVVESISSKKVLDISKNIISKGVNPIICSRYYDYFLESYFHHYALVVDVNDEEMLIKDSYKHFFPELHNNDNFQLYRIPFQYINSEESTCNRWLYGSSDIKLLTLEKKVEATEWQLEFKDIVRKSIEQMKSQENNKGINAFKMLRDSLKKIEIFEESQGKVLVKLAHLIRIIIVENRYLWWLYFSRHNKSNNLRNINEIIKYWIGLSNLLLFLSLKKKFDLNVLSIIDKIEKLETRFIMELESLIYSCSGGGK